MFPADWFEKSDKKKLDEFVSNTVKDALVEWAKHFKKDGEIPPKELLQDASRSIGKILKESLTRPEFLELINGGERLEPDETSALTSHLEGLLPEFRLPQPLEELGDVSPSVLGIVAAAGTCAGFLFGGRIAVLGGLSAETGHLFGAILGSCVLAAGCIAVANRPTLRKNLVFGIGAAATVGTVMQTVSFFSGRGSIKPFLFLFRQVPRYIAVLAGLALLKRSNRIDRERFRQDAETFLENYIRSALPLAAVLLFLAKNKVKPAVAETAKEGKQDTDLVFSLIPIINRSLLRDKDDADELIQELIHHGYSVNAQTDANIDNPIPGSAGNEPLIWAAEWEEKYETFGHIDYGVPVEIKRDPIIKDGEVKEKGLVKKKR